MSGALIGTAGLPRPMRSRTDPYRPQHPIVPELSAGAIVLHPVREQVLLLHEVAEDRWTLPKGHVDPGESLSAAALREVTEETGLAVDLREEIGEVSYRFFDRKRRRNVLKVVVYFLARARAQSLSLEPYFDAGAWVSLGSALRRVRFNSDRIMLQQARAKLRARPARSRRR